MASVAHGVQRIAWTAAAAVWPVTPPPERRCSPAGAAAPRSGARRHRGDRLAADLKAVGGPGVDLRQVKRADSGRAHNMRNQQKDDLIVDLCRRDRAEEVLEERNLAQPGPSADALVFFFVEQAADQVDLALFEANHLVDGALADDRLGDAADRDVEPLSEEISIFSFRLTSRLKWMVGFMSMLTPTSMY